MPNSTGLESEVSFVETSFKTTYDYTDVTALAKRFQNLLFMEPGTLPNLPLCGIGIKTRIYSLKDELTLSTITNDILNQIEKYMPNSFSSILNVSVDFFKDRINNTTKGIIIYFIVSTPSAKEEAKKIAITAEYDTNSTFSQNILSDIYI